MQEAARIARAATAAKGSQSLEGLRAVVALRRDLAALEALHVDSALAMGCSWTQIAEALGVSKQAAHKRHAQRNRESGSPSEHASRRPLLVNRQVREVVRLARREAETLGGDQVGPEHLLLALLRDVEAPHGRLLTATGVKPGDLSLRVQKLITNEPA